MFPKQLIVIYRISAVGSVIDDGNNENKNTEWDDEDDSNPCVSYNDIARHHIQHVGTNHRGPTHVPQHKYRTLYFQQMETRPIWDQSI